MTNLQICYSDIPYNAITITPSVSANEAENEYNLIAGPRWARFRFGSTSTSRTIKCDLGSGNTSAVDYLAICRADRLQYVGITSIVLASSSDDSSYTDRITASSFSSQTLYGPRLQDYIQTITATSAFRYWRLTYTSGGATAFQHSKVFFGSRFTFDRAPYFEFEKVLVSDPLELRSGAKYLGRASDPSYRFKFQWSGLTESTIINFDSKIAKTAHIAPVLLYTTAQHQILDSQRLVHAKLLRHSARARTNNYWVLEAEFEEIQG